MKTSKIILYSLAAALVAGGVIATKTYAADSVSLGSTSLSARPGLLKRIADKLNLTSDQRSQIKDILVGDRDTLAPLLSAVHDARKDLRAAIRASDASEASVRAASAKVASAEADLAVERMKLYGKIAPILTDAQRQQLSDMQQQTDDFVDGVLARLGSGLGE